MDDLRAQRTSSYRAVQKYEFPLDKESTKYQAKIIFNAREVKSFDVNFLFDMAAISQTVIDTNNPNEVSQFETDIKQKQKSAQEAGEAVYQSNYGNGVQSSMQKATGQNFKGGSKGKAILYLPQAIQIADQASYDNIDLGILGAGTQSGLQAGGAILPKLYEDGVNAASSILAALSGNAGGTTQELARLAVTRAANKIPGKGVSGAVSAATRVAINPNTRAQFKSIPLREFTFSFKMIPTSKEETKQIKGLIKFFRTQLYPEVIPLGDINAGYKFPNVFEIDIKYGDDKQLATKILPSYIKTFLATYNSSGMGFLEGGDFSEVDITMSFIESGTLHQKLIKEGY